MSLGNFLTGIERETRKGRGTLFCWQLLGAETLYQSAGGTYTAEQLAELEQRGWTVVRFRWRNNQQSNLSVEPESEPEEKLS